MARSLQRVRFVCDARQESVPVAIYIAGSQPQLGDWTPNLVRMYDDGTNGDMQAGDSFWSLELDLPVSEEVQYKYTNSGARGEWVPSEEFAQRNRSYVIPQSEETVTINDVFGK